MAASTTLAGGGVAILNTDADATARPSRSHAV